jgi:peptidoglycan hydrolase-like protein with peptidoglycan-binding domain
MRSHSGTVDRGRSGQFFLLQAFGWTPKDAVGVAIGTLATLGVLINVLFMQSGVHPAPMFNTGAVAARQAAPAAMPPAPAQRMQAAAASAFTKPTAPSPQRTPGEIITDIQRELSRRGYYDGAVDGLYGPKTDSAIRDFEHAAGLKPSTQPNEALLQAIMRAPGKAMRGVTGSTARAPATGTDAPAPYVGPSPRLIAVQRALAEFGYGQIKASGLVDADTRHAIEKFERERQLPITGQISERLLRELAAVTGRPLE